MTRRNWSTSTLGERVRYIIEREGVSQNELGRRAGIKGGPMSRIANDSSIVSDVLPKTLAALADAGGVRFEWLALGRGQPERTEEAPPSSSVVGADPYPNRTEAARIAREDGSVPDEAIRAVLQEDARYERDPSVLWWIHMIDHYALRLRLPAPPMREAPMREPSITPVEPSGPRTLRAPGQGAAWSQKKK